MVVLATAGHVDHGKSTLVRCLTGTDPDRWDEERRRGLTIDLGFAEMELPSGNRVALIDVPGHHRFIKNMLAGVGSVSGCLFVVAADEGWKPQSEEHLRIMELVGVSRGVVVLSKAGNVDSELLELVKMEVADSLAGSPLEGAAMVSVDAVDGTGVPALVTHIDQLVQAVADPPDRARPRLWIDRSFSLAGAGTIVTGTLTGGVLAAGDEVVIVGAERVHAARIRAIQSFGRDVDRAGPGSRVALNVAGVHYRAVRRGDALIVPDQWHITRCVDASLRVLAGAAARVTRRGAMTAHIGADEVSVRLQVLGGSAIEAGSSGFVRLTLPRGLPLLPGDRYVLRDVGRGQTVGGGEILDVDPVVRASAARPDRSVERVVRERGWVSVAELERLTGVRAVPTIDDIVVHPEWAADASAALLAQIDAAGEGGLALSGLDERARLIVATLDEVETSHGSVRRTDTADSLAALAQPYLEALDASPFAPPSAAELGISSAILRGLKQRGQVMERDGLIFSATALQKAAQLVAELLQSKPSGVTISEIREAMGTTRKWALPLAALLDAMGATRRQGDVRVAGPRLPAVD